MNGSIPRLALCIAALCAPIFGQGVAPARASLGGACKVDPGERWVVCTAQSTAAARDIVYTMVLLIDPKRNAESASPLRSRAWPPHIRLTDPQTVAIEFDTRVPGLSRLIGNIEIMPADSTKDGTALDALR